MRSLVIFVFIVFISGNVVAQGLPEEKHIIISGSGYVERMPDYAEINLSVSKTSETLKQSKDYVDKITQQIIDAAIANDISPDDIGASKIYAEPHYKWAREERKYLGERVRRSITLVLRNLSQYSVLVQALIDAEVTELEGIQLLFSDRSMHEREAMTMAIADAKKRAAVIASQFGTTLGGVYKISEAEINDHRYYQAEQYAMLASVADGGRRAELKIRKQRVSESVYVVFLLGS